MSKTITTTFTEVSIRAEKSSKCITCGKKRKRIRRFWQTLNPFNKKADGTPKNASDIREEEIINARAWKKEPIDCCGDKP